MSQRALLLHKANAPFRAEAFLIPSSITLLAGLAVADRLAAWLIGEFPSSALLWQVRFEYLRPVGVYYDILVLNYGWLSPIYFSVAVLAAAVLLATGALSRARIVRALSYHALLAVGLVLVYFCSATAKGVSIHGMVGAPSDRYLVLGTLLSLLATVSCLRVHFEYLGWAPRMLGLRRHLMVHADWACAAMVQRLSLLVETLLPALAQAACEPAAIRRKKGEPKQRT